MDQYAPEYTKIEKVKLILKHMVWALPLFAVTKYWFFPWFEAYVEQAHCYSYGPITGIHLVFYFIFVGLPLLPALFIFAVEGPRYIKVIKIGQYPLPGEKVHRTTRYTYGIKAKARAYCLFAILLFLVGLSMRGVFWANDIISMSEEKTLPACVDG